MRLVCPDDAALIARLDGRNVCVRVDNPADIVAAAARVRQRNSLICVICETTAPLGEIEIAESDVPLALIVPSLGRVRDALNKVAVLRKLNLRVYLPCRDLTGARVLASLGIAVSVDLTEAPDWDGVADLMTYALLGLAPHAPVEPFHSIAAGYKQAARCDDWGHLFFDDPTRYLHLDAEGHVALSRRELLAGQFAAGDLSELDSPELKRAIAERAESWRDLFADDHFCARCAAWRICRARLRDGKGAPDGCDTFFLEMVEVIEQNRRNAGVKAVAWQP
jgi:hypothetical protein